MCDVITCSSVLDVFQFSWLSIVQLWPSDIRGCIPICLKEKSLIKTAVTASLIYICQLKADCHILIYAQGNHLEVAGGMWVLVDAAYSR